VRRGALALLLGGTLVLAAALVLVLRPAGRASSAGPAPATER